MHNRQRTKTAPKDRTPYQQYTLTDWGHTPWPDLNSPSAADCQEVYSRLMAEHGSRLRPAHITAPSLEVAGCGEVPQVLDAIIRTMISANTKFEYADAALKSLVEKVGVISDNKGLDATEYPELQHCLDYNYIRTSMTQQELEDTIATAGNQKQTASRILTILADVYGKNKDRVDAFKNETPDDPADSAKFLGANLLSEKEKQWEIKMFENSILHLEFLKKLSPEHAMNEMLCWKGVGVKTAACVLMFCMQEDILACDTHCIRLAKWLEWVPVEAKDELVFAHVNNRVPNHLKYALHQLFIQHGKDCILCRDDKEEKKGGLEEVVCPLEDLLGRGVLRAYKAARKAKIDAKNEAKQQQSDSITGNATTKEKVEILAERMLQNNLNTKGNMRKKARTDIQMKAKGKSDGEAEEHVAIIEEGIIVDDMVQKRTGDSTHNDEADLTPAKRTRTHTPTAITKRRLTIPITDRKTRSQTKAKQEEV